MSYATDLVNAKTSAIAVIFENTKSESVFLAHDIAARWGWKAARDGKGLLTSEDAFAGGYIDRVGSGADKGKWYVTFANPRFDEASKATFESEGAALRHAVSTILAAVLL